MKNKLFIKAVLIFVFISGAFPVMAQEGDVMTSVFNYTPQLFACIISGVILALAFQSVLTMVSVATGISLAGNLEEKINNNRKDTTNKNTSQGNETPVVFMVTTGVGVWTILTACISLFFASLLAVKMVAIPFDGLGFTLGLVIWAAFFMIMMYLEVKSISSLLGGIFNTALQGIRSTFNTAKDILAPSEGDKIVNVAEKTVDAIHRELAQVMDNSDINKKIEDYINRLQPKELDYTRIRKEITQLLDNIELDEKVKYTDSGPVVQTFLNVIESHPKISKQQAKKLISIVEELKGIVTSGGSQADKITKAFDKFTPGSEEDTKKFREKIERYLRDTGKAELDPDKLKKDFETMMRDPKSSKEIIKSRLGMMNRATVASLISQRTDLNKEEADKIAGYVEKALDFVKNKFVGETTEVREKTTSTVENVKSMPKEVMNKFENKIKTYLDSLNREEFNYERIKMDFQNILHDPKATFDILKGRLNEYDRESLITLLSSNDKISRDEAERIVAKIEEARDNVIEKAQRLKDEAKKKFEEGKLYALRKAELTRKAAASAAWWLVGAAVVSGIASGLGGMIGID